MKKLLLFAMALILAACSAAGGGTDLTRNQSKWEKAGIKDYRYALHIGCFCAFRDKMPLTVEVRDGKMVSMSYADGTPVSAQDVEIDFFKQFSTIDGIFADLTTGDASKADKVEVTYDATYGFPARVYVDRIEQAADDEYSVEVSNFEVLK